MDKLNIINKSISEIRSLIGAECASIEELPELIKNHLGDSNRGMSTTAFVFSAKDSPVLPTSSSLDVSTGLILDLEED
jgi:hypothetical protein